MAHNGGRSQVNLDFLQGGGEFPFINHMKTAPFWSWNGATTAPITPDLLDTDGYPLATPANSGLSTVFFIPTQAEYATDWVLAWDGNGTVTFGADVSQSTVSGGPTSSPWRITGLSTSTKITVGISVVGTPRITNMRCYPFLEQTAFNGGAVFSAKFKQRLTEANFGVIRFMNWQAAATGGNNSTTWDTAVRPTTYFQFQSGQIRSDLLCNAAGSGLTSTTTGSDYTISAPSTWSTSGGLPADKSIVHVVFGNDSTQAAATNTGNNLNWPAHKKVVGNAIYFSETIQNGGSSGGGNTQPSFDAFGTWPIPVTYYVKSVVDPNTITITTTPPPNSATGATVTLSAMVNLFSRSVPTLNVAGTAAVPILDQGAQPMRSDTLPVGNDQGSLATLVYDAQLNVWLKEGGSANTPGYIQNGVPYSLMIQLCNEVGAHPWFTGLNFTCTPISDFWTQLPTLVRSNGQAWMVPRFEGPNECFAGTAITQYPGAISTSYGWGADQNNWYGKAISLIGQAVNAVYGGTPATQTAYQVICGIQTTTFNSPLNAAGSDVRLTSLQYVNTQGGSAASNWVSHVCGANYFQPSIYGRNDEIILAFDYYVTKNGNASAQQADADSYEAHDTDGILVQSFTNATSTVNTSAAHGLALGQIIGFVTTGSFTGVTDLGAAWVNTIPTSTSFTISSTDPNNGGATPVTFSGAATGVTTIIPNNSFTTPFVKTCFQNIATWAAGKNANIKVACYEGGYSPDYAADAVYGKITGGTNTTNCVLTINNIIVQKIHNPNEQSTAANPGIVAGMRIVLSGMPASGGWSAFEGMTITVTSVSGTSVTTTLDASPGAGISNTLGTALAGSYVFGVLADVNGVTAPVWMNALRYAGKASIHMQANLTTNYNDLVGIAGVGFPSMFQLGGNTTPFQDNFPSSNVWSVLEDVYTITNPPQWLAVMAFNAVAATATTPPIGFSVIHGKGGRNHKMIGY